eukprot:1017755-Amphidinium_carterae.1
MVSTTRNNTLAPNCCNCDAEFGCSLLLKETSKRELEAQEHNAPDSSASCFTLHPSNMCPEIPGRDA